MRAQPVNADTMASPMPRSDHAMCGSRRRLPHPPISQFMRVAGCLTRRSRRRAVATPMSTPPIYDRAAPIGGPIA